MKSDRAPGDVSPEDVDRVLLKYYQSELPDPWPEFQKPTARATPPRKSRSIGWAFNRSRFALAASLLILLLGQLFLPIRPPESAAWTADLNDGRDVGSAHPGTRRSYRGAPATRFDQHDPTSAKKAPVQSR